MANREDFDTRAAWIAAGQAEAAEAAAAEAEAASESVDLEAEAQALGHLVSELAASAGLPREDVRCRIAAELDRWGRRAVDLAAVLRVGCSEDDG